jgi:predicted acetylornithine/succinylornithine family transaminase
MNEKRQNELLEIADRVLLKNYRQQPIVMSHGKGVELWDVSGRRYLDMTAGIAVCNLGHAHPAFVRAVAEQAEKLVHTSNLYFIEQQILAAQAITDRCFGDRVFFCNSGAEANEAALKLARRYQHVVAGQPHRNLVVSTHGSFHGRSIATVSITGQDKYREGFGPMFEPVAFVPFGDLEAAARVLEARQACAFIVEPVQAEGGIVEPPPGYLAGLRKLCDDTGTLLLFDEVQTGVGRTGTWFAHQHEGVLPDAMSLAKGLAGGVPIGALVASERAAQGLTFVQGGAVPHASTFGGNPLACATSLAVFRTIEEQGLLENCTRMGAYLGEQLAGLAQRYPGLARGARGRGLLRGLVLEGAATPVVSRCRELGLLVSVAGNNVVRFAPALIVERGHLDEALGVLDRVLAEMGRGASA